MSDFFRGQWERPVGRYLWVGGNGKRFLTDGYPNGKPYYLERYEPLKDDSLLFSEFADLYPATEEKIRAFAEKYGFLGEGEEIQLAAPPHDSFFGERLFLWVGEISAMKNTLGLWKLLKSDNHEALARMITWKLSPQKKPRVIVRYFDKDRKVTALKSYDAQHRWEKGDVIAPGWYHIQNEINEHMGNGRVSPRLIRDGRIGTLSLFCVPQNLIGALWLQFAQAVARDQRFLQCAYCQKPFLIGVGAKNSQAQYCKPTCRNLAWRKRKAEQRLRSKKRESKAA